MRKKWTYVAIVSMMLGVAPVFTGCVDTDEPAGITELRGAKAELLRAKAVVQEALAKVKEAEALYKQQEAAWMQAKAEYEAQLAREKELKNDLLEAQNEYEKQKAEAAYQAYLEDLARQKAELDKQLEADLLAIEEDIAASKLEIERLRQQLELAKISGTDEVQNTITALQRDVETAYAKLYGGEIEGQTVIGAVQELFNAKKAEQEALAYQNSGFDCTVTKNSDGTYTVSVASETTDWVASLEAIKQIAETELEAAEKLLTDLETYGDKDVEGTDWKAEVEAIQAELDKLEAQLDVQKTQLDQAHATPEYLAALQAVEGVWEDAAEGWTPDLSKNKLGYDYKEIKKADGTVTGYQVIVEKGASQLLTDAKKKLMDKQKQPLFSYDAYEAATPVTAQMELAINAAIAELNKSVLPGQPNYVYPTDGFGYAARNKIVWGVDKQNGEEVPSTIAKYPAVLSTINTNYTQWITMVGAATIDPNEEAQAAAAMKRAQDDQKAANDAYEAAKKGWETLQGIIAEEKAYSVPTTDFTKSTTAYNTAFKALDKAIKDWNEAVEKAYNAAKDEAMADWKFELQIAAINNALTGTATAAFDKGEFYRQWNVLGNSYKTEDKFKQIVDEICDQNADPDDPTQLSTDVWKAIETYVQRETTVTPDHPRMQKVLEAAKEAVSDKESEDYFDAKGDYIGAITKAKADIAAAVWTGTTSAGVTVSSLNKAVDEFNTAAKAYVQVPADTKKQAIHVLIGVPNDKGETSGFGNATDSKYYDSKYDDETGKTTYTINVTDITDEEITGATKTKYDTTEGAGKAALIAESLKVFGLNEERYVAPSKETLKTKYEEAKKDKDNAFIAQFEASFAGKAILADNVVEGLQNQIDASDDLKALKEELVAAQAAFKKSVEDQYAANFGDLEAAVTTATTDLADKQKALDAENAKFHELDVEIAKLQAQIDATEDLKLTLQENAWKYLGITWPETSVVNTGDYYQLWIEPSDMPYDPEEFAKLLQEAINHQKLIVAEKEKAVQLAEADLQKAQAEGYNGVDQAYLYVQIATMNKENAEKAYTTALENLQKAMDVLAGTTSAE